LLRNQKFAELSNDIGDILLDNGNWLRDEALNQQVLCLDLVIGGQADPESGNDFAKVDRGELANDLRVVRRHQHEEKFESADCLEEHLKNCGGFFDCIGIGLLELSQDIGKALGCDAL